MSDQTEFEKAEVVLMKTAHASGGVVLSQWDISSIQCGVVFAYVGAHGHAILDELKEVLRRHGLGPTTAVEIDPLKRTRVAG